MRDRQAQSGSARAPVVAFFHFDLHTEHFNSTTTQVEKYEKAFSALGWQFRTVAGAGNVSHLIPGMQRQDLMPDAPPIQYNEVLSALKDVELVWIVNLCTSPYNRRAADLLVDAITELDLPTIFNHHDLRGDHDFEFYLPVDQKRPWHTVIASKGPLEGVDQKSPTYYLLGPGFDLAREPPERSAVFQTLGLEPNHRLFAQPTRFDPAKNVIGALQCALEVHLQDTARPVTFWITGAPTGVHAKGEYLNEFLNLAQKCEKLGMTVRWGKCGFEGNPAHAAYSAADLIFYPPHKSEGFGLPPIEAALYMRPVAVGRDRSVEAVRANAGLKYLPLDSTAIGEWFSVPERVRDGQLRLNRLRVATRFSFGGFVQTIRKLLQDCHLDDLVDAGEAYLATTAATEVHSNHSQPVRSPFALDLLSPSCARSRFEEGRRDSSSGGLRRVGSGAPASPFELPLPSPVTPI